MVRREVGALCSIADDLADSAALSTIRSVVQHCRRSGRFCDRIADRFGCAALPTIVQYCRRHVCSIGRRLTRDAELPGSGHSGWRLPYVTRSCPALPFGLMFTSHCGIVRTTGRAIAPPDISGGPFRPPNDGPQVRRWQAWRSRRVSARDGAENNRQGASRASGVTCRACWADGLPPSACIPRPNGVLSCVPSPIDRLPHGFWR
jgi:hypothetical protein